MFRSGFDTHLTLQNFEMNAMVAFNLFQSHLVVYKPENKSLFYGGFQTFEHFALIFTEQSLNMFRSGFDTHLTLQNFEMNAMVAFNLFQSHLVVYKPENKSLFYGGFQTFEHFALIFTELSLNMFRSGFDTHLTLQNFEMNAMVAFNLFQSHLVVYKPENKSLFYGGFQTFEHFALIFTELSLNMFRSGFDTHLTLQNFEMNAMVAFNLFQSHLVVYKPENKSLFYGGFQTFEHFALIFTELSLNMFRSGFDTHLTLQNFEMNAMVAFNLFQSHLVVYKPENKSLFYGGFQTFEHFALIFTELSLNMFRSGFDTHLTLQNFEMNAMVAFNLFQSHLVVYKPENKSLFYGGFQTFEHFALIFTELSLNMFRSGFDTHLTLQNFEMNAMVAFNLFQSHLVVYKPENKSLFYGGFQTFEHFALIFTELSLNMFRSGFDTHLTLQNFEMNAMVAFNLFQSHLVVYKPENKSLFYGGFQTFEHFALIFTELSLNMFRSGFDTHLTLQNFEMNAMVAFNLFQSHLVVYKPENKSLFYGGFQTFEHFALIFTELSLNMFRSGFDTHLTLQNFEMNAMVAFNLFQSHLVVYKPENKSLFYGGFQTFEHFALIFTELSLNMFRSGFDTHLTLQNFEMNAMVAFNLFQSHLVVYKPENKSLFYGGFQTFEHFALIFTELSLNMFRSGFDTHLTLQNFEMNAMVAFNLFQSHLVVYKPENKSLFYGGFQTFEHFALIFTELSLNMFRSGFDTHLTLQNFEMNAMVAFNLFQSHLVVYKPENKSLFYGGFQTFEHFALIFTELSLNMFRSGFDTHLTLQNFEMNAMVAFNLFQSHLVVYKPENKSLFYGGFQTFEHFALIFTELSLNMFRSGFDTHLTLQNFEMNAMVAFNLFQSHLVVYKPENKSLFYGGFQTFEHFALIFTELSLNMFRSGFDTHLTLQNFEMNAMVAFNLFQSHLVVYKPENKSLFYGGFQTFEHFALIFTELSLNMFRSGFDTHLTLQNFEMNAMVAFNLFQSHLVVYKPENKSLFYGGFQTFEHFALIFTELSLNMFRSGFDTHLTLQNFEMNAMVAFNLFQSHLVVYKPENKSLFYGGFQTFEHFALIFTELSLNMFRSGFDTHLTLQNFEMNAMVAFNLFQSHLVVYKPENKSLFYGGFQTFEHFALIFTELSLNMFRSGFDTHLTLQNFEMNAMVAFNLFQSHLVVYKPENKSLFYGGFQTFEHFALIFTELSLNMFRSGFDTHLTLQNFEMNAMVAFNLFQSHLVVYKPENKSLFYGGFQTFEHFALIFTELSLNMFRSGFDTHLTLQNFEMNAMVAFNLFQSHLVVYKPENKSLFYGGFQTFEHFALIFTELSLNMFRSGFDTHLTLQNFEMNAMVAFNLFQSHLVVYKPENKSLFYGGFQTFEHFALIFTELSLNMFRSGFDTHLTLQNFEMNAMVAFNLFQSHLVVYKPENKSLFYGGFQTFEHFALIFTELSLNMFRSGFDTHLTLQNFEMNAMVAFNLFQSHLVVYKPENKSLFYGGFQTFEHFALIFTELSLNMFRSGFDTHLTLQNFEMNAMVAFNLFQSHLVVYKPENKSLFYGGFQTFEHFALIFTELSLNMFRSGFDTHLTLQNFEMNAMVAFNLFQSHLVVYKPENKSLFYGGFQTYKHFAPIFRPN